MMRKRRKTKHKERYKLKTETGAMCVKEGKQNIEKSASEIQKQG